MRDTSLPATYEFAINSPLVDEGADACYEYWPAGVEGWAICEACHKQYTPTQRRPKTGQRNFCGECRKKGVPQEYALRDYRERKRKKTR